MLSCYLFLFQAEDGIRDYKVTGVQTCALPIWPGRAGSGSLDKSQGAGSQGLSVPVEGGADRASEPGVVERHHVRTAGVGVRSEERRVGREWRSWGVGCWR